uniref:Uncharacterized protein n=1 Tax=viral metagenome TaxID=1070528 RepID=A0A6C0D631_9ZZZZ
MARARNICPPGVFCITPSFILLVVILLAFLLYASQMYLNSERKGSNEKHEQTRKQQQQQQQQQQKQQQQPIYINVSRGGDDRYTRAPEPTQNYYGLTSMATRGIPDDYQSMGVVKTSSGELLPLYGRRVASRSDRFNYYTRTDTNNPIPLPIKFKRRDCQDDNGCEELYDGENVEISPTQQNGTVSIYRFNGPLQRGW